MGTESLPRLDGGGARAARPLHALTSDERLAEEIRAGSDKAFEVLYTRHRDALLSLCRHMLGSQEEAEEALQHSFAAAWSDLQRPGRPIPPRLRPWLFAIARNRCLSLLRARRPDSAELTELPATAGLSDEVARRAELRGLLADLRELPEEQRTALLLSEIGGLSHADIADVLDREEHGVKGLVFRARSTLMDWREARDAPCEEFREQLAVLHGGALRRRALRRHLHHCPGCRAFREEVKRQRSMMALILPVVPSVAVKKGLFAAWLGGGASGGVAGGGAGAGLGLGTAAVVSIGSTTAASVAVVGVLVSGGPPLAEGGPEGASAQRAQVTQAGGDIAAWSGPRGHAPGERDTPPRNKSAERVARETDVAPPEGAIRQPGDHAEGPVEELDTFGAIPPAPPAMHASDTDDADDVEKEKAAKGRAPDERPGNENAAGEEADEKKGGEERDEPPRVNVPRSEKEKAQNVIPDGDETEDEAEEEETEARSGGRPL